MMNKDDLKKQREALKADIRRMNRGPGGRRDESDVEGGQRSSDSDDQLANTNQSHFTVALGK